MKINKKFTLIAIILIVITVLVIGGSIYFLEKQTNNNDEGEYWSKENDPKSECLRLNEYQCSANPSCFGFTGSSSCTFHPKTNEMSCPELRTADMTFRCYLKK